MRIFPLILLTLVGVLLHHALTRPALDLEQPPSVEDAQLLFMADLTEVERERLAQHAARVDVSYLEHWQSFLLSHAALADPTDMRFFCTRQATLTGMGLLSSSDWRGVQHACRVGIEAVRELEEHRRKRSEAEAERESLHNEIVSTREHLASSLRERERLLETYSALQGTIVRDLGGGDYEIQDTFGGTAILETTETVFTTRGRFSMLVRDRGTEWVTLRNGRQAQVRIYRESADGEAQIRAAVRRGERLAEDLENLRQRLQEVSELTSATGVGANLEENVDLAKSRVVRAHTCLDPENPCEEIAYSSTLDFLEHPFVYSFPGAYELQTVTVTWKGGLRRVPLFAQPHRDARLLDFVGFQDGEEISWEETLMVNVSPRQFEAIRPMEFYAFIRGAEDQTRQDWRLEEGEHIEFIAPGIEGSCLLRSRGELISTNCPFWEGGDLQELPRQASDSDGWSRGTQWWLKIRSGRQQGWIEMVRPPYIYDVEVHMHPDFAHDYDR